ncbi:carboxypeptidase-like regulatory domain-containing protein [Streptococcus phage MissD]|nr:carboxypeptidase-like regulatory domain-containing protein [Streptococcus phage MissD]
MTYILNSTNLKQVDGGFLVKQGDVSSTFSFSLLDENHEPIPNLEGQEASITLTRGQEQLRKTAVVTNGAVAFNLGIILPAGTYRIEVVVAGYVFPSDDSTQIRITKSDKNLVTEEIHTLKELDIAEEVKKQLAGRTTSETGEGPEFPDLLMYYNIGKV